MLGDQGNDDILKLEKVNGIIREMKKKKKKKKKKKNELVVNIIDLPFYLSGTGLRYGLNDQGFESRQRLGIFFFTVFRRALGPTQNHI
jgi:hypothetical protein